MGMMDYFSMMMTASVTTSLIEQNFLVDECWHTVVFTGAWRDTDTLANCNRVEHDKI